MTPECLDRFRTILLGTPRGPSFGNGRFARNLLEAAIGRHAWRLRDVAEPTVEQLRQLVPEDLEDDPVDADATLSSSKSRTRGFDRLAARRDRSARRPHRNMETETRP